jgi:hypothetical protein
MQIASDPFDSRNPRLHFSWAENCQSDDGEQNAE